MRTHHPHTAQYCSYLEITGYSASCFIRKVTCSFVTDPGVHSTTSRVKPSNVLKAKIFAQSLLHDLDSHGHEFPALVTNAGSGTAAFANLVIIGQIDIEDKFTLLALKETCLERLMILRRMRKDSTDINLDGLAIQNRLSELLFRIERLIADVDFFSINHNSKGKFSPRE